MLTPDEREQPSHAAELRSHTVILRTTLISAAAFAGGVVVGSMWGMPTEAARSASINHHWRIVNTYRDFMRNPANFQPDPQFPGMTSATAPLDPEPSLTALASAGELIHVDLVFPRVTKVSAANRLWMKRVEENEDIIYASGNPVHADYRVSGDPVLHLQLWFLPAARTDVQHLIGDLEVLRDAP